jgi:hypothetical protein
VGWKQQFLLKIDEESAQIAHFYIQGGYYIKDALL